MQQITRRGLIFGATSTALLSAASPSLAAPALSRGYITRADITYIQVRKTDGKVDLIGGNRILKSYDAWFGHNPVGHKRFRLDGRTPEGVYTINRRNPRSKFYRSLGVSYPNARDRAYALARGKSPGGDIMIHGQTNGRSETLRYNWTAGCIAVSNSDMSELWKMIPIGCPINIFA